jgi:hypothetical protein
VAWGLIAITLAFGMLSNLMLLPCLVLTLNKSLANKQEFIEPKIDILNNLIKRLVQINN